MNQLVKVIFRRGVVDPKVVKMGERSQQETNEVKSILAKKSGMGWDEGGLHVAPPREGEGGPLT